MEEDNVGDFLLDDLPDITIPVEVDMVVDDNPLVFQDDEPFLHKDKEFYQDMIKNGLTEDDFTFYDKMYRSLDTVRSVKMHCTTCNMHLGTAAKDENKRFAHPLLKVVMCRKCFEFYLSGEFETDEDGSELYCRWCGEGGEVYCCAKCPYVFCKRCIKRNLGASTAREIQDSDNWFCFSCNPSQISKHRVKYWAVQKYSEIMVKNAKTIEEILELEVDGNLCCGLGKRRIENPNKAKAPVAKRPKLSPTANDPDWKPPLPSESDVICMPDVISIEDSPPSSPQPAIAPKSSALLIPPPALIPKPRPTALALALPPPLVPHRPPAPVTFIRPGVAKNINIANMQKPINVAFTNRNFVVQSHSVSKIVQRPLEFNNKLKLLLAKPGTSNTGVTKHYLLTSRPIKETNNGPVKIPESAVGSESTSTNLDDVNGPQKDDWFITASKQCSEVNDYISTKISGLTGVHSRAHKSSKLMEELHNTLQTYLFIAIEKLNKIKKLVQENYEKEWTDRCINPFALENVDNSNKQKEKVHVKKHKSFSTNNVTPDDMIFDMDVTNDSDEDEESVMSMSAPSSPTENEQSENHEENLAEDVVEIIEDDDDEICDTKQDEENKENSNVLEMETKEKEEKLKVAVVDLDSDVLEEQEKTIEDSLEKSEVESKSKTEQITDKEIKTEMQEMLETESKEKVQSKQQMEIKAQTEDEKKITENRKTEENDVLMQNDVKEMVLIQSEIKQIENEEDMNMCTDLSTELPHLSVHDNLEETKKQEKTDENDKSEIINHTENKEEDVLKHLNVKKKKSIEMENTDIKMPENNKKPEEIVKNKNCENQTELVTHDTKKCADESKENIEKPDDMCNSVINSSSTNESPDSTLNKYGKSWSPVVFIKNTDEVQERFNCSAVPTDTEIKPCQNGTGEKVDDIEEVLSSNVVLRANQPGKSFGDEFSKFIDKSNTDKSISLLDSIRNEIDIAHELEFIPEYVESIYKDNGSLSLPPDTILDFQDSEVKLKGSILKDNENGEVMDSEILALKHLAENCVSPPVDVRESKCRMKSLT